MPSAIREFEGNRGKRSLNAHEPKPRARAPKCPEHLDEDARHEWRMIVPKLARMKVLTEVDGIALSELCQTYATLKKAQIGLNLLVKAGNGRVVANPLLGVIRDCSYRLIQLCREFGLTPSSRARIQVATEQVDREDDSLLNGRWKAPQIVKSEKNTAGEAAQLPVLGGTCEESGRLLQ